MCGRFALFSSPARIRNHFDTINDLNFEPRFNIAPSTSVPVIHADKTGMRFCELARWGLIPSWIEDPEAIQHPINAKAETAAIKPMFRHAYRSSRILIPADAFYEWTPYNGKQPFLIKLKDNEPMGLGGLFEHWQGYETEIRTFSILTTPANQLMADIHDRMPVIIRPEDYSDWLDTKMTDIIQIQAMTKPYPERFMEAYPISRNINNPLHDSSDLILPIHEPLNTKDRSLTPRIKPLSAVKSNKAGISR